jgi:RNA polymerase sigma factor (sigma-70 family)
LRAWKYSKEKKIDNIRALLYRILKNIVADKFRKKKTSSLDELLENGFQPSDREHEKIILNAESKNFVKFLESLEDNEREILIMRYIDGMGPGEIADTLSERSGWMDALSANVVSVRLNRAINKLQKLIK